MRSIMGLNRLTVLVLIHRHYYFHLDIDVVVSKFEKLYLRKMELQHLVAALFSSTRVLNLFVLGTRMVQSFKKHGSPVWYIIIAK